MNAESRFIAAQSADCFTGRATGRNNTRASSAGNNPLDLFDGEPIFVRQTAFKPIHVPPYTPRAGVFVRPPGHYSPVSEMIKEVAPLFHVLFSKAQGDQGVFIGLFKSFP
jgi:hypothetical protein